MLVIGTSGVIHTPIWLSEMAQLSGAVVVNINPHPGKVDKVSDMNFKGTAAEYFQDSLLPWSKLLSSKTLINGIKNAYNMDNDSIF